MTSLHIAPVCMAVFALAACTTVPEESLSQSATFSDGAQTMTLSIMPQGERQYVQMLDEWLESPLVTSDPDSPFAQIVGDMEWQQQTYVFYHGPGGFGYIEYWPDRAAFLNAKNSDVPGGDTIPPTGQVVTESVVDINGVPFRKVHSYYNHGTTATGYIPGTSGTTNTHCAYFPENMNGVLYVGAIDALDHDTCRMLIDLQASVSVK